jgi:hypothetical protein
MTNPLYRNTCTALCNAYVEMANEANYRPAAPSDGFGHIMLTDEQLDDQNIFDKEAEAYAEAFNKENLDFHIGCCSLCHLRALVYMIEAARTLCGGKEALTQKLLRMAAKEIRMSDKRNAELADDDEPAAADTATVIEETE